MTETATVTSVHTNIETAFASVTVTTLTTTIHGPTTTFFAKRETPSPDPSSKIVAECSSAPARISSACSCILTPASTVTVVETVTIGAVATEAVQPTFTVPAQAILNGNFEGYTTDSTLAPWTDSTANTGSSVMPIPDSSVCTPSLDCTTGTIVRVYAPGSGTVWPAGGYTSLTQKSFLARPSTTHSVSFLYRCNNWDGTSSIDVRYNDRLVGGIECSKNNFNRVTSGIQFTTDATGLGKLEIRFANPSGSRGLYWYVDEFAAKAVN